MQTVSKFIPEHLPQSLWDYRNKYEHHLIIKMGGKGIQEAREYLESYIADGSKVAILNVMQSKPKQQCFIVSLLQVLQFVIVQFTKRSRRNSCFRCCITSQ